MSGGKNQSKKERIISVLKGQAGEVELFNELVEGAAAALFESEHIIHNATFIDESGAYMQIDFIFITEYGVFAFDSKNWGYPVEIRGNLDFVRCGRIKAFDEGETGDDIKSMDTIRKTMRYAKWLKQLINVKEVPIYSIVVMGKNCSEVIPVSGVKLPDNLYVVKIAELNKTIEEIKENYKGKMLKPDERRGVYKRLREKMLPIAITKFGKKFGKPASYTITLDDTDYIKIVKN